MSKYKLYGKKGSGSWVIQVALEEAGAPYERIWVGDAAEELERYRAVNPTGRVPALELPDGTVMMESAAMLIHLAAAHPGAGLAPAVGSSDHARLLQWMVYLSANVYEAVLRIYYSARFSVRGDEDAAAIRDKALAQYLDHLELIARGLGPHVLGREYSIADAYLHMLAAWYPGEKATLWARIPQLEAHAKLMGGRAAVRKADADNA